MRFPQRGEIYWVNLDPTIGSEIAKTRPAVIISNNIGNQYADRVIVAPITSAKTERVYPFEALIPVGQSGLPVVSKALLDQIRTIDKSRLGNLIGMLDQSTLEAVNRAIRISLDL